MTVKQDNLVKHEDLEGAVYLILAPGANKTNTKIRADSKSKVVHISVSPSVNPKELREQVDLSIQTTIDVGEQYDMKTLSAKVASGIIFVAVKPDVERIIIIETE